MTKKQRNTKLQSLYDQSAELSVSHWRYRQHVKRYLWESFKDDAWHDTTTRQAIRRKDLLSANIVAKEAGIVAGVSEVEWLANKAGLQVDVYITDGQVIKPGDIIVSLHGNGRTLLEIERVLVTALQRMSGIATTTAKWVAAAGKKSAVAATRKTLWGWLDKRAVAIGGGFTHRLNLQTGVMVKDNHWIALEKAGYNITDVFYRAKQPRWIEVDTAKQLREVVESGLAYDTILLDNFTPTQIKRAITWLKKERYYNSYMLEASGGITLENAAKYAASGVDVISSSALTAGAQSIDLSLDIV